MAFTLEPFHSEWPSYNSVEGVQDLPFQKCYHVLKGTNNLEQDASLQLLQISIKASPIHRPHGWLFKRCADQWQTNPQNSTLLAFIISNPLVPNGIPHTGQVMKKIFQCHNILIFFVTVHHWFIYIYSSKLYWARLYQNLIQCGAVITRLVLSQIFT